MNTPYAGRAYGFRESNFSCTVYIFLGLLHNFWERKVFLSPFLDSLFLFAVQSAFNLTTSASFRYKRKSKKLLKLLWDEVDQLLIDTIEFLSLILELCSWLDRKERWEKKIFKCLAVSLKSVCLLLTIIYSLSLSLLLLK